MGADVEYSRRLLDDDLDELMQGLPAISIEGPKAVGKTRTAMRHVKTVHRLDDPDTLVVASADPSQLLAGERPVLIDEWQQLPATWDLVRRAVDDGAPPGSFLLTGSASPLRPPTHSGAGRIVSLRLRPLSIAERVGGQTVSLAALLRGEREPVTGVTPLTLQDYVEEIVSSGLPGIRSYAPTHRRLQLDGYLERIVDRDIATEAGLRLRNPTALHRWMAAYAAATATTTSFEKIRLAASPDQGSMTAKDTALTYRDALSRIWMLDPVKAWLPAGSWLRRLGAAPKHHLADPALAARLLGVDTSLLLSGGDGTPSLAREGPLLGALFESLVTQSVSAYAARCAARLYHLRTRGGAHEVDLIVQRDDGRIVALEVKLARVVNDDHVRQLHWLREQLGDRLLDSVVISTGPQAYRRADGIAVVPLALLGP